MTAMNGTAYPRLQRLLRAPLASAPADAEQCDLCGAPVEPGHRHLVELHERRLLCACRPCALLFDRPAAGGGHYRLVPERCRLVPDFVLEAAVWERFRIPVEMAFFFRSTPLERVVAFYPSPAGPVESLLELESWSELEAENPVLRQIEPDVEALLVHRSRGAGRHWLVPIDACYRLVALMRTHWHGLGGGAEVRSEIEHFFESLWERASLVQRDGSALAVER
jgi:hypothetical protein